MKQIFALCISFLFVVSIVTPMVVGFDLELKETVDLSGPMDSPWPMSCHDNRHTGRSPYSTAEVDGTEKWRFACDWMESGIVIDNNGILYFGGVDWYFYALNPDGTLKWKYMTGGRIMATPAIADDGTVYVGSWDDYLYAFNPDGTVKWKFYANDASIDSSPAIAEDGTIYFGTHWSLGNGGKIHAINPDGTEKWHYQTGYAVLSDPAIAEDGTIYIGSFDNYLYALYPNGTLRWRFKTGDTVYGNPSIADDGTIYISSYDDYLYALNPDGSIKWKTDIGEGTNNNPTIGDDGTIYVSYTKLYAIRPNNGNIKWTFDFGPDWRDTLSCHVISSDDIIYVGVSLDQGDGGDIIAINKDGYELWRKNIADYAVYSSACIGSDGTVYIGSASDESYDYGYIHAFGPTESNEPPQRPTITGTTKGKARVEYTYIFNSIDPNNNPVSFYIDWGDGKTQGWTREYASGENVRLEHTYTEQGMYEISARARDTLGEESDWGTLNVRMPRYKTNSMLYWFLEEHPRLFPILRRIIDV